MSEAFEVFDERFRALLLPESRLEHLAEGCIWAEGPVWLADDSVVWSDIPNNRMLRWSAAGGPGDLSPALKLQQRQHPGSSGAAL